MQTHFESLLVMLHSVLVRLPAIGMAMLRSVLQDKPCKPSRGGRADNAIDNRKLRDTLFAMLNGAGARALRQMALFMTIVITSASHAQTPTSPTALTPTILVYGDSLSAAYGLDPKKGWVHLLSEKLRAEKFAFRVVNASISGETTAGGVARLSRTLSEHRPKIVLLELGANDGLRGLPIATMRSNLMTMIREIQKAGALPVLVGMQLPPNFGSYARDFGDTFGDLAKREKLPLVPFLLAGIADKRDMFLPDNLHPTAAAQPIILANVWQTLAPVLKQKSAK
jgi:acyl-CoA thioesterase I